MEPTLKNDLAPEPLPPSPGEVAGRASRRRRPFLILAGLLLLGAVGVAVHALLVAGQEETDDAQVEGDVIPLGPRVPGQVLSVAVAENQAVRRGDLVLQIDPADYQARVAQAEAELSTARAQAEVAEAQEQVVGATATGGLASAEAAVSGSSMAAANAESQVTAARAAVGRAEADTRRADLDLARARQLAEARVIAQEALDHAESSAQAAHAALAQAEALLGGAQEARRAAEARVVEARGRLRQSSPVGAQLAAAHAAAELARARVKSAEAALRLSSLQLSYTRVLVPEDGVVSRLGVHEGQIVQGGQPVVELVPARTYVVANFKETQVGDMRPGQRARIRIDAFPGRVFEGKVESRSGGTGARFALVPPDNASGNFVKVVQRVPVRIAWVVPPDGPLAAGLSADVVVEVR
ncbi:MAG TPA: HlyD family secretion protein [Anaeromyxobacter sp.]|nr:HlyD family secretion protein [Anaeromyxobacter sp.]